MSADLIRAIADLAWPILATVLLIWLLPILRKAIQSRAVTIKYGQIELSIQDASDQLRKQVEDLQNQVRALQDASAPVAVHVAATERPVSSSKRRILWVDDKPRNNAHEIAKLQKDGWDITVATSTQEALELLESRHLSPAAIVSDMGRREGLTYHRSAGLDLLHELRMRNVDSPVLIYTAASEVEALRAAAERAGAKGITSSPIELFRLLSATVR